MSAHARGPRAPRAGAAAVALAVTLAIQIFTALAATATSVLAPEIGSDLGIAPRFVGVFVGLLYAGAMAGSLVSGGLIERFGAIRVSQACVLLCAVGLLLVLGAATWRAAIVPLLLLGALVIGTGYGPITPASTQILVRTTSPARMALTFSIKQTGVPAGAALAGALLPAFALAFGWETALACTAAIGIPIAAAAQGVRAKFDAQRTSGRTLAIADLFAPLAHVVRTPPIRELAITGFVFAGLQVCLLSYLVVYLTETLGYSLVAAGLALTAANIGAIVGRILLGAGADNFLAPRTLLGLTGIGAGACAGLTVAFTSGWPWPALLAVCVLFGTTAIGWNGVQLAEIARLAPKGQEGTITGATNFISFGGVFCGPPLFAVVSALTDGYRGGFALFGVLTMTCGLRLLVRHRK